MPLRVLATVLCAAPLWRSCVAGVLIGAEDGSGGEEVSLLQRHLEIKSKPTALERGQRDLVLMHIPYNFGHTVENVAMFGSSPGSALRMGAYVLGLGGFSSVGRQASWEEARSLSRKHGEIWGHLNPDLQVINKVTGCPMYYTPQKYWPEQLAAKYFGNKTVFGMLRDPYERLVAFFRGNLEGYGGSYPEFLKSCDVNGAVKKMMLDYLAGDKFANGCTFLPQAEFFDGPYGIKVPIDNRFFPSSMNKAFVAHGYPDFHIATSDVLHVALCQDVWAADLDAETRSLVKKVYAADFELLCKHFGYCDNEENCCIFQVPMMCPPALMRQGYKGQAMNFTK